MMRSSQPFRRSRWQLAAWYTGVMSLILIMGSYVIYRLVVHARWLYLERDMQQLAIALERRVRPFLEQPGQLNPGIQEQIPMLCLPNQPCAIAPTAPPSLADLQEILNIEPFLEKDKYCIRFVDPDGATLATLNIPFDNTTCQGENFWEWMRDRRGEHYHRRRYPLQTLSQEDWGYLYVARSLDMLDWYLLGVELALLGLLILSIALVGYASWWLAGMAMQPLRESYEQMQQFTADAAHELRTPVAAIRAMVQAALRSSTLTHEEVRITLQTVERQSSRLSRLMQDLLVLSQIEQDTITRSRKICDLIPLLKDLVEEFQPMATQSQVNLTLDIQTTASTQILGYSEQLHRAIANLLSNGIQYTPAGGRVELILTTDVAHDVLIQVRDTGIGIAPASQSKIFDRFYRVEKERSRHSGGAGLGLAIVQAIVHSHQGTIEVESEPGQGSTFTIRLPHLG